MRSATHRLVTDHSIKKLRGRAPSSQRFDYGDEAYACRQFFFTLNENDYSVQLLSQSRLCWSEPFCRTYYEDFGTPSISLAEKSVGSNQILANFDFFSADRRQRNKEKQSNEEKCEIFRFVHMTHQPSSALSTLCYRLPLSRRKVKEPYSKLEKNWHKSVHSFQGLAGHCGNGEVVIEREYFQPFAGHGATNSRQGAHDG